MKQMFYGGVHPAEHKEATEQKPIQPLANAPAQVVIPMSMHIGAPCKLSLIHISEPTRH